MKYMNHFSAITSNIRLLWEINRAADRLHRRLTGLDLDQLEISTYIRNYLKTKLQMPTTHCPASPISLQCIAICCRSLWTGSGAYYVICGTIDNASPTRTGIEP